ncbi:MAG: ATP-dependent DNA helicase RecG [Candidatus Izemoplasmatales bacterium]
MELKNISGVGKVTLEKLNNLNIKSVEDMLFCFPKKYEINSIDDIENKVLDKTMTLKVEVISKPKLYYIRKKLTKMMIPVKHSNYSFTITIFNREFLMNTIYSGVLLVVTGKFLKNFNTFSASNMVLLSNFKEGVLPVYGLNDITEHRVRTITKNIIENNYNLSENLPDFIKNKRNFKNINETIKKIHIPQYIEDVEASKARMAYEEFLMFAIRVESIKKLNQRVVTPTKNYDINKVKQLINSLPFELTDDQKSATNEIFMDFKKKTRMNRLLQGDVGSGKTIISIISSYAVVTAKFQVAILAPTLVLAKQHYQTFIKFLKSFNVDIALLTSETNSQEKIDIFQKVRSNHIDIIIGTHSLLQESIVFNNLGFVVIDEQQRFGVEQRKTIRKKGIHPDILMMTATPIPRTLAISLFENSDVSTIREKPSNRKSVYTKIVDFEELELSFKTVDSELHKNRQIYVICPLIETSDLRSQISTDEAYIMMKKRFKSAKIDILHGKMNDVEKTQVLDKFYRNETQILISTTVVEVGVNIENATTMLIFNANAFGLAQIHQLRGRIGRNDYEAFCYLIIDNFIEDLERLKILEETNDGFAISEYDLALRGPGEVFGSIQSGVPNFRFANIIKDEVLRDQAFEDAKEVIVSSDALSQRLVTRVLKSIDSYNLD